MAHHSQESFSALHVKEKGKSEPRILSSRPATALFLSQPQQLLSPSHLIKSTLPANTAAHPEWVTVSVPTAAWMVPNPEALTCVPGAQASLYPGGGTLSAPRAGAAEGAMEDAVVSGAQDSRPVAQGCSPPAGHSPPRPATPALSLAEATVPSPLLPGLMPSPFLSQVPL